MEAEFDTIFESLYRDYFPAVEIHAYQFLKNREEAHSAAQRTFQTAWEKWDDFHASPNQIGWLKNTAKNISLNKARALQRQTKMFVALDLLPEEQMPHTTNPPAGDPLEAFRGLIPDEEFRLFTRIVLDGYTCEEIANELGIRTDACRKRMQRTREKLRKAYLKKYGENVRR